MGNFKTSLFLGICIFAMFLLISYKVGARELAQQARENKVSNSNGKENLDNEDIYVSVGVGGLGFGGGGYGGGFGGGGYGGGGGLFPGGYGSGYGSIRNGGFPYGGGFIP